MQSPAQGSLAIQVQVVCRLQVRQSSWHAVVPIRCYCWSFSAHACIYPQGSPFRSSSSGALHWPWLLGAVSGHALRFRSAIAPLWTKSTVAWADWPHCHVYLFQLQLIYPLPFWVVPWWLNEAFQRAYRSHSISLLFWELSLRLLLLQFTQVLVQLSCPQYRSFELDERVDSRANNPKSSSHLSLF